MLGHALLHVWDIIHRIEEEHLLEAFQTCRNDIKLSNCKKLSNELLTSFYQKVKKGVDAIIPKMATLSV
jgi:hypothetical protein